MMNWLPRSGKSNGKEKVQTSQGLAELAQETEAEIENWLKKLSKNQKLSQVARLEKWEDVDLKSIFIAWKRLSAPNEKYEEAEKDFCWTQQLFQDRPWCDFHAHEGRPHEKRPA